jgi:TonB family protein
VCRIASAEGSVDQKMGEYAMRLSVALAAIAAAFLLTPVAAGYAPALSQDFSITNTVEPADSGRRDLMRQLQAWWDTHAYYPKHASNSDEGGTVKVHLVIKPDGNIWMIHVVESSGSSSLDAAGVATFHGGFVRPFPEGAPGTDLDVSLHYVLAHRHDQPVDASYTPVSSKRPFTIMNDPVKSPILDTMLQRTCTGTVVRSGIRNHPAYGSRHWAQAVFFRKPDGTPWVQFYEGGYGILAPVVEVGKLVTWTGREEHLDKGNSFYIQYAVWPDGDNHLTGNIGNAFNANANASAYQGINTGGTVDFTCATEVVPAITWSAWSVTPGRTPPGDPP